MRYMSKTRELARLLQAGQPEEYIAGMEDLLKTAKGKNLRDILILNLTAGYVELRQFDTAIAMLEELSARGLKGAAATAVHHINLCLCYFETGQSGKAMALYRESQPLLERYRGGQSYGAYIAVLDMLAAVRENDYVRAEELLGTAMRTYSAPRMQKAFHEIEEQLRKKKAGQPE